VWTVKEAACATVAAALYFEPFRIRQGRTIFTFEDATNFGANNPAELAFEELHNHPSFKQRQIGCFLSLGSGKTVVSSRTLVTEPLQHFMNSISRFAKSTERVHQNLLNTDALCVRSFSF
jgi:hypothetical protein